MRKLFGIGLLLIFFFASCQTGRQNNDIYALAKERQGDLRFGVYITAHSVQRRLSTEAGRREALSLLRCNGITKAFVEVYRGGLVIPTTLLTEVRDFFLENGIDVVGGIATVPGGDFGVRQEGQLGWFNWQNEKTQHDLKAVIERSAPLFDEFIIDDFLCTADTSLESRRAKGEKSWSQYRRDLLVGLSEELFIKPAKRMNPDIALIIKYPQWYDRFHLFGYDPARESKLFDRVWVGTETRGQYTQRYGFVQPFEGFINFRWIATLAGDKMGGAWFDHGDCNDLDFIEQAYQSVLAGAREIVLFHYGEFVKGHPGHHLLRTDFEQLADLARTVAQTPVHGVPAYKPPNSDAGGDLYIMDFIGMLGACIVPVSVYPADGETMFLPTQAAADKQIAAKVLNSLDRGAVVIMTSGFLQEARGGQKLAEIAGVKLYDAKIPLSADAVFIGEAQQFLSQPLHLQAMMQMTNAQPLLEAKVKSQKIPFLTKSRSANVYVLNSHTFSQADFDAVGEVLLCPKPLGLLGLPDAWANVIRGVFNQNSEYELRAPTRVTLQPIGDAGWFIHNYNRNGVDIQFKAPADSLRELFLNKVYKKNNDNVFIIHLPARSRVWLRH